MAQKKLVVQKNYVSKRKHTKAHLDAAFGSATYTAPATQVQTSIENYLELYGYNDTMQILKDVFVTGYALNQDGVATRTHCVENKQTELDTAETSISLGLVAAGAWSDVDANNAAISIDPEVAGEYRVNFDFPVRIIPTGAAIADAKIQFRLIDSNSNYRLGTVIYFHPMIADAAATIPVHLEWIATFTTASQNVRLQKRILSAANLATCELEASAGDYGLNMSVEKV
jgi:hypothetical protein